MTATFPALVLRKDESGSIRAGFEDLTSNDLPEGDVLVRVTHSSVNYKDGLAITGKGKIARSLPMIAGIDLAGVVEESTSDAWKAGDPVLATGWGLGEERFGGYSRFARLDGSLLTAIPRGWSAATAMALGTAGFTAMLAVFALEERGIRPDDGPVVVTGASGGVGSVAVALLAHAGYTVAASTGRPENHDYLRSLGANSFLAREDLDRDAKPLESDKWAGAVDTVGGRTLATLAAQIKRGGAVSVCGNAGGFQLPTTVFPLILRGVALLGIDSNYCPPLRRRAAWNRLALDLPADRIASWTETVPFRDLPQVAERITNGQVRGRIVVEVE
ncbi:MAG: oxidoreductase [Candidatus Eisenbacteria bacterium]|uniref:Oxidoreductase n=1 Tax=Eiseniibacteriota bacterium TaxID=2212470 RepID=A0A956NDA3_UNCEI|nr:oxidoreductase [Candidatus Eisenbacteria bacterium]